MDNIPAVVINYSREIIPAPTLDFEIGKIGLPHLISEFSLMMEFISSKDKIMLRKRSIIETINDMLKNVAQIVHTRHRSISNFSVNLLAGMAAYAFYDTKPSINMEFEMEGEAGVKQLTFF